MSVFVAVLRQTPSRTIEGTEVHFVKLARRKFFGYETCDVYDRSVSISAPAKTLVDCLDRPDLAGGPSELAGSRTMRSRRSIPTNCLQRHRREIEGDDATPRISLRPGRQAVTR